MWQFACREEHIPRVGDHTVYDIAGRSYLIMRSAPDTIKAFPNACLHRGRQLKQYDGNCSEIRCPFHGFAWHLDGSLQDVPARWDLPHVTAERFHLPEVKVGTWDGFVFINPDPDAEPLEDFVKELAAHFDRWNLRDRYVQAHVSKIIEANWKIAQEAFCEAFHVNATHPQILPYIGDTNSQVDVWENCSRVITPAATPSPLLDWTPDDETILRYALDVRLDEELFITRQGGPDGPLGDGRRHPRPVAAGRRRAHRRVVRRRDGRQPRLHAVPELPPVGRVQPHRLPLPAQRRRPPLVDHGGAVPRPVQGRAAAAGAGAPPRRRRAVDRRRRARRARQGVRAGHVQHGAACSSGWRRTLKPGVTLANYQESKVRWLHVKLEQWLNGGS